MGRSGGSSLGVLVPVGEQVVALAAYSGDSAVGCRGSRLSRCAIRIGHQARRLHYLQGPRIRLLERRIALGKNRAAHDVQAGQDLLELFWGEAAGEPLVDRL